MSKAVILTIIFIFLTAFFSCLDGNNPRKGRPNIKKFFTTTDDLQHCTEYIKLDLDIDACYSICPTGTKLLDSSEIQNQIDEIKSSYPTDLTIEDELLVRIDSAKGVCGEIIQRPTNEIFIKNDFCACHNNKPFISNNCEIFCSDKNDSNPTLYASVNLGPKVSENEKLGNLFNWCKVEIDDGNFSPSCVLVLKEQYFNDSIQIELFPNANYFRADISLIQENKTYIAHLQEITSSATSSSIQLRKLSDNPTSLPILRQTIASQYSCITRTGYIKQGINYYENSAHLHYYYPIGTTIEIIPPSITNIFCHDINSHGVTDSLIYPRLELITHSFQMWDKSDSNFFDTNGDGKLDINEKIEKRLNDGSDLNLFNPLLYNSWPNSGQKLIGYYMTPWIDRETQIPFCPKNTHYNSNTPIYSALKEVIGKETEAIYFARREHQTLTDDQGNITTAPSDHIIIREADLKKGWFYIQNGQTIPHSESTSYNHPINFYYPIDSQAPLVKKPHQHIYTIINPNDENSNLIRQDLIPKDLRFGCIPIF